MQETHSADNTDTADDAGPIRKVLVPCTHQNIDKAAEGQIIKAQGPAPQDSGSDDDVDDYLRKIYLARKMKAKSRVTETLPEVSETLPETSETSITHRFAAGMDTRPCTSFSAAAALRKQEPASRQTAPNSPLVASFAAVPSLAEEANLHLTAEMGAVGRICREARARRSPSPEHVEAAPESGDLFVPRE
jgi:hypothetical protein